MTFIGRVLAHDLFKMAYRRKDWCIRSCGEPSRLWERIPDSERQEAAND